MWHREAAHTRAFSLYPRLFSPPHHHQPGSGDTSPCRMTGVTLHSLVTCWQRTPGRGAGGIPRPHTHAVSLSPRVYSHHPTPTLSPNSTSLARERELCIDNLLVRIHFIIEIIWWTGLAPWESEFPVPGSPHTRVLSLSCLFSPPPHPPGYMLAAHALGTTQISIPTGSAAVASGQGFEVYGCGFGVYGCFW